MIQGIFMSNQGIVGDRVGDFASAVLQIAPTGTALLLALTSGMGKSGANDTVFHWFEDSHQPGRAAITAGGTTTTIDVDDASQYVPNQILLIEETGEIVMVTTITGNELTVIRGMSGTSIVNATNVMHVQSIGNAHEEASGMPVAITQQGSPRQNYTQIFRNAWAVSGTAKAVQYRTGNKVAHNKKMCAMYHAEDMERAFIFGRKHVGVVNSKPFRLTDGVIPQIENYGGTVVSAATDSGSGPVAGEYSRGDFEDFIRRVFAKNVKGQPNERIALGGDLVLAALNRMTFLDGTYNIKEGETKVGIMVTTIQTPFGKLNLMTHPLFNENPAWQKQLLVLHPGAIRRRMLRETNEEGYDKNGNRINAKDADEGVITTEVGIEVGAASTMGILRNVNKAVATK